jgi:hypothetical protein
MQIINPVLQQVFGMRLSDFGILSDLVAVLQDLRPSDFRHDP